VGHIRLLTDKGSRNIKGYGVGKDLYREALAAIGSFFSNLVGGGDVSLEIKGGSTTDIASTIVDIDGKVEVGIENIKKLYINSDGTIDETNTSEGITVTTTSENLPNQIQDRINTLDALITAIEDQVDNGTPSQYANSNIANQLTANESERTEKQIFAMNTGIPEYLRKMVKFQANKVQLTVITIQSTTITILPFRHLWPYETR